MIKASLIKQGDGLFPATAADMEQINKYAQGSVINSRLTGKSSRSYQFHKLYFGGLLRLALDYWQPTGGILTKQEKDFAKGLVSYVKAAGFDEGAIKRLLRAYMQNIINERQNAIEAQHKDIESLHKWVKVEAGYYDSILTPDGVVKEPKSISFDTMTHEDFKAFYKRAFNVVWNMILSKSFSNQDEAQSAIDHLSSMG